MRTLLPLLTLALGLSACVRHPVVVVEHAPVQPAASASAPASTSASPPAPAPAKERMGSIDKDAIRAVIQANRGEIVDCYEKRIETAPKLTGKVAVKFVIGADGKVTKSGLAESTVGDAVLESCVVARVGTWTFPPPRGGGVVVVTYPFLFKQAPVEGTVELMEGNPPTGGLTRKALIAVFEANRGEIIGCYNKSLRTAPKLEGSMSLELIIGADGRVTKAGIAKSTAGDPELEGCVAARMGTWTFPPPTGGTFTVTYPLSFLQVPRKAAPAPKQ